MAQEQQWYIRFTKERFFWMVSSAILVTIIIGFSLYILQLRDRLKEVQGEREYHLAKVEASQSSSLLSSSDVNQLKKQGISNPEQDLAADLMEHRELIPYEGVMGGTMGFYSKQDIHILTSRWILASFEDGHIGGHMLLEYRVDSGGKIHWRVMVAYLD